MIAAEAACTHTAHTLVVTGGGRWWSALSRVCSPSSGPACLRTNTAHHYHQHHHTPIAPGAPAYVNRSQMPAACGAARASLATRLCVRHTRGCRVAAHLCSCPLLQVGRAAAVSSSEGHPRAHSGRPRPAAQPAQAVLPAPHHRISEGPARAAHHPPEASSTPPPRTRCCCMLALLLCVAVCGPRVCQHHSRTPRCHTMCTQRRCCCRRWCSTPAGSARR
jgi:hypothetical protein